ncbi:LacI family DNA-binding transcriptional regulator [Seonamhaeicola sp.]|uniref:LacI family DNA-binding transcriptional regulator n=1 Tax=Seonamhaeicola sp. TaxID=1912245 RepID=UPI0026276874|nr:LacI family DNA-binding transcriptional regulator [Seonamhaeicola sp.]
MTTIKDIAKKANVSTGTVDRVIHNRPGVSEKTKIHVQKIIEEHNFQINTIASTLALNKSYKIGVLIPEARVENEFWSEPKKGIEKAAEEIKNFRISTSFFTFDQFDSKSYVTAFKDLIAGDFDAVLMAPVFHKETSQLITHLDKENTPYVFINIDLQGFNTLSFIGQDSFKSGHLAAKLMSVMLADSSEIIIPVFRLNKGNYSHINDRITGFKSFFKEKKSSIKIKDIAIPNFKDLKVISSILDDHMKGRTIDGIFVPSSRSFLIAEYLETAQLENIRLIGYDTNEKNIQFLKNDTIDFLICQNPYQQGFNGIKLLSDYLVMNKAPNPNYHSPMTIVTKENVDAF